MAKAVTEASEPDSVARLLERLATLEDAQELRDMLVFIGAEAVMRQVDAR